MAQQPEHEEWIDTDEGLARAEQTHRHAGHLAAVMGADEKWWQAVERRNSFRARWAAATGRSA